MRYFGFVHLKYETIAREGRYFEENIPLLHRRTEFLAEVARENKTIEWSPYGRSLQFDFIEIELGDNLIELGLDDICLGPIVESNRLLVLAQVLAFLTGQVRLLETQVTLVEDAQDIPFMHRVPMAHHRLSDVPFER